MRVRLAAIFVVAIATAAPAHAEDEWHAGLAVRGDLGTHQLRIGGGVQLGRLDTLLVLDPMFWTDGQIDTDVLVGWYPSEPGWGVFGGWRDSSIELLGGRQFHEKLVLGVGATLPPLGPFEARFQFELATLVLKHGGDLPSDWISFASGRDFIDLLNFGVFVTIEYGRAL